MGLFFITYFKDTAYSLIYIYCNSYEKTLISISFANIEKK
ncbi:hypothetical protein EZS27_026385 [termite gut metagenome]|uniref:Uncharacterized protein n=1 Tax=termite gut metagenome TaxID=433724 RepID=A0A5J4QSU3_9ZZZZ